MDVLITNCWSISSSWKLQRMPWRESLKELTSCHGCCRILRPLLHISASGAAPKKGSFPSKMALSYEVSVRFWIRLRQINTTTKIIQESTWYKIYLMPNRGEVPFHFHPRCQWRTRWAARMTSCSMLSASASRKNLHPSQRTLQRTWRWEPKLRKEPNMN